MIEVQIRLNGSNRDLLFPTPSGRLWRQRNFYRDVWKPTPKGSGLDIRPHECRHSYVTHLRTAGINDADLAEIAGHRVETMLACLYECDGGLRCDPDRYPLALEESVRRLRLCEVDEFLDDDCRA